MKKIWLVPIFIIFIVMMFTVYQQHRVISDYRSLHFVELEKLNTQFERFLVFHKESEKYDEKERNEKLQQLTTTFFDFSVHVFSVFPASAFSRLFSFLALDTRPLWEYSYSIIHLPPLRENRRNEGCSI